MMIRLADEMGFKVATFQHVLEGYKVAKEIAAHGAGGSTFSDWWGYKIEAEDAIPGNASVMTAKGVTVSINSDSAEHARRLNTEAAKSVRWGDMTDDQAIAMVTINPGEAASHRPARRLARRRQGRRRRDLERIIRSARTRSSSAPTSTASRYYDRVAGARARATWSRREGDCWRTRRPERRRRSRRRRSHAGQSLQHREPADRRRSSTRTAATWASPTRASCR